MFGFGELRFESSRAFADDEDEEGVDTPLGVSVEWTEEGNKYIEGQGHHQGYVFCAFDGKVALGFGQGYLDQKEQFTSLGQILLTESESTVDLCSLRARRKTIVRLLGAGDSLVFALIDFYGVPRHLVNEVVYKIRPFILQASNTIIFHSEIAAYYCSIGEEKGTCNGKLYYLSSSEFDSRQLAGGLKKTTLRLPPPNIVAGCGAGILTLCEQFRKPGLLLITYADNEVVDSISLAPFFDVVNPLAKDADADAGRGLNLAKLFSPFRHSIHQSVDFNNLYV